MVAGLTTIAENTLIVTVSRREMFMVFSPKVSDKKLKIPFISQFLAISHFVPFILLKMYNNKAAPPILSPRNQILTQIIGAFQKLLSFSSSHSILSIFLVKIENHLISLVCQYYSKYGVNFAKLLLFFINFRILKKNRFTIFFHRRNRSQSIFQSFLSLSIINFPVIFQMTSSSNTSKLDEEWRLLQEDFQKLEVFIYLFIFFFFLKNWV